MVCLLIYCCIFDTHENMMFLKKILFISRPRIWIYTVGSFALGVQVGSGDMMHIFSSSLLLLMLWLTLPINVFLYALNDAYDVETDLHNPKKRGFERQASLSERKSLLVLAAIALAPAFFLIISFSTFLKALFIIWLLIVVTYNIPPLRFKGRPFLDLFFAFNFPLWGVIGYIITSHKTPTPLILLALALFAVAMHIYTSIPDIASDRASGLITSAVFFGSGAYNLVICIILTLFSSITLLIAELPLLASLGLGYILFFSLQLYNRKQHISLVDWYRYFIYLHYGAGIAASIILNRGI